MAMDVLVCAYCGAEYELETGASYTCFCDRCTDDRLDRLPTDRYLVALRRLRDLIKGGLKLTGYDCTAIGAKSTECTWGLCWDNKELWPDKQDHIWPHEFETRGRVAPLGRQKGQPCPLDTLPARNDLLNHRDPSMADYYRELPAQGCFYRCRFFQKIGWPFSRESIIDRIDEMIEIVERDGKLSPTCELDPLPEPEEEAGRFTQIADAILSFFR